MVCNRVNFTPTVAHCTMATLIGLCIRVKLLQDLAPRFKVATTHVFGRVSWNDADLRHLHVQCLSHSLGSE